MTRSAFFLQLTTLLVLPLPAAAAQQQQQPPPGDLRITSDVQLVLLDVGVQRKNGSYARDLTRDNFQIFDNGKPTPITSFQQADLPLTLGIVIDASGSMRAKRAQAITAALHLITQSHPDDEIFLVAFHDEVTFLLPTDVPFTSDRNLLRESLLKLPTQGRTTLYDAIHQSLDHLHKGTHQRKALVLISDGGDNASHTTEQQILHEAQQSHATIYTVGIYNPIDPDRNPGLLRRLAQWTGGQVFLPKSLEPLPEIATTIAQDQRSRYLLGFAPAHTDTPERRKIKVTATSDDDNNGKLKVRTRQFYFTGQEPPSP